VVRDVLDENIGNVARKCLVLAMNGDMAAINAVFRLRLRSGQFASDPIELPELKKPQDAGCGR
jgi:hypothetical protein